MHILIAALHRPTKPTGVCRYSANLAQALVDREEVSRVTLVIGKWQKNYFEEVFALTLSSPKITIEIIDINNNSLSRNFWFLLGLPKLASDLCSTIVHLAFPLPFFRSFFRCSVIATIHDLYAYDFPENFGKAQSLFNRLFFNNCIHQADALTCVSTTTRERLNYFFPDICISKNVSVIYNYVDFSKVIPIPPVNGLLKDNDSFWLSVGQHRPNKNLDLIIKAFKILLDDNKLTASTKLVIVGDSGPTTEKLFQLISVLNLDNNVLMLSGISDAVLCWLYQNCQLFVIPSSTEGFCVPLAEALYQSCQVVCSAIPIFKEVGTQRCIYFDLNYDPIINLTKAIIQAIDLNYSYKNYGDRRFSKETISKEFIEMYSFLV